MRRRRAAVVNERGRNKSSHSSRSPGLLPTCRFASSEASRPGRATPPIVVTSARLSVFRRPNLNAFLALSHRIADDATRQRKHQRARASHHWTPENVRLKTTKRKSRFRVSLFGSLEWSSGFQDWIRIRIHRKVARRVFFDRAQPNHTTVYRLRRLPGNSPMPLSLTTIASDVIPMPRIEIN